MSNRRTSTRAPKNFLPSAKRRVSESRRPVLQRPVQTEYTGPNAAKFVAKAINDIGGAAIGVAQTFQEMQKAEENAKLAPYEEMLMQTERNARAEYKQATEQGDRPKETYEEMLALSIDKLGAGLSIREDFQQGAWDRVLEKKREAYLLSAQRTDSDMDEMQRVQSRDTAYNSTKALLQGFIQEDPSGALSGDRIREIGLLLAQYHATSITDVEKNQSFGQIYKTIDKYISDVHSELKNNYTQGVLEENRDISREDLEQVYMNMNAALGAEVHDLLNNPMIQGLLPEGDQALRETANTLLAGGDPADIDAEASKGKRYIDQNIGVEYAKMDENHKTLRQGLLTTGYTEDMEDSIANIDRLRDGVDPSSFNHERLNRLSAEMTATMEVASEISTHLKQAFPDVNSFRSVITDWQKELASGEGDKDALIRKITLAQDQLDMVNKSLVNDSYSTVRQLVMRPDVTGSDLSLSVGEINRAQLQMFESGQMPGGMTMEQMTFLSPETVGVKVSSIMPAITSQNMVEVKEGFASLQKLIEDDTSLIIEDIGTQSKYAGRIKDAIKGQIVQAVAQDSPDRAITMDIGLVWSSLNGDNKHLTNWLNYAPNSEFMKNVKAKLGSKGFQQIKDGVEENEFVKNFIDELREVPNAVPGEAGLLADEFSSALARYAMGVLDAKQGTDWSDEDVADDAAEIAESFLDQMYNVVPGLYSGSDDVLIMRKTIKGEGIGPTFGEFLDETLFSGSRSISYNAEVDEEGYLKDKSSILGRFGKFTNTVSSLLYGLEYAQKTGVEGALVSKEAVNMDRYSVNLSGGKEPLKGELIAKAFEEGRITPQPFRDRSGFYLMVNEYGDKGGIGHLMKDGVIMTISADQLRNLDKHISDALDYLKERD